jgi:hypothetical protein
LSDETLIPPPVEAAIYKKLHATREDWCDDLRRARDYQAEIAVAHGELKKLEDLIDADTDYHLEQKQ